VRFETEFRHKVPCYQTGLHQVVGLFTCESVYHICSPPSPPPLALKTGTIEELLYLMKDPGRIEFMFDIINSYQLTESLQNEKGR
jgi:hypothetical protein